MPITAHPMQPTNKQILEWFEQSSTAKGLNQMDMPAAHLARMAYAAGADAELEACCEWLSNVRGPMEITGVDAPHLVSSSLRAARRPKPLSLKQQALAALDEEQAEMSLVNYKTILAVLESLPDPQD